MIDKIVFVAYRVQHEFLFPHLNEIIDGNHTLEEIRGSCNPCCLSEVAENWCKG